MHTLTQIAQYARLEPSKPALIHDGVALSYSVFLRRIASTRQHLATQALPPSGVVVIASACLLDDWILLFAVRSLGLSTAVARSVGDIHSLDLPNVVCVLFSFDDDQQPSVRVPADFPWPWLHVPRQVLDAAVPSSHDEPPLTWAMAQTSISASTAGHILRTSGTTGTYKKVMRDLAAENSGIEPYARINAMSAQAVVYVANYPLWTASGYRWPLTVWAQGGTVVMQSSGDLRRPLAEHRFSHMLMTPDKLTGLLALPPADGATPQRNPAMRLMVTGGALSPSLLAQAQRVLTPQVCSVLASTEASIIAITPLHQPQDLLWHCVHPLREVQVVDEHEQPLGPGVPGRLRARINDGLAGYLGDEAATREHFRDGFFYPGDVAVLASDGRLSLQGRASDVINVLGGKVATAPMERALRDRLQVSEVCLLTIPNARLEDELHLVIETPRALGRAPIAAAVDAELRGLPALPVQVHFTTALPRNEMGKVRRLVLRQQLLAAQGKGAGAGAGATG